MPGEVTEVDIAGWVERARADTAAYMQRQATEIFFHAISMQGGFRTNLYLKGGILMGLTYSSPRHTGDIDMTTTLAADSGLETRFESDLDAALSRAAAALGYADLLVKTHSVKKHPSAKVKNPSWPALEIKIGYAKRGSPEEERLKNGRSPHVIDVDISFNEPMRDTQILKLTGEHEIRAYGLHAVIAEKFRAMLQQEIRNRERRQDVYDLHILITGRAFTADSRRDILDAFKETCRSRGIEPDRKSLESPELRRRSKAGWDSMKLEIGELPDFEECFARVHAFYRSLPW